MNQAEPDNYKASGKNDEGSTANWKRIGACFLGSTVLVVAILLLPWGALFSGMGGAAKAVFGGIHVGLAYLSFIPMKFLLGVFLVSVFSTICIWVNVSRGKCKASDSLGAVMTLFVVGSLSLLLSSLIESAEKGRVLQPALDPVNHPAVYRVFHSLDNDDILKALDSPGLWRGRTWEQVQEWAKETLDPRVGELTIEEYQHLAAALKFSAIGAELRVSHKKCLELEAAYQSHGGTGVGGVERKPMIFRINGQDVPQQSSATLCQKGIRDKVRLDIRLSKGSAGS